MFKLEDYLDCLFYDDYTPYNTPCKVTPELLDKAIRTFLGLNWPYVLPIPDSTGQKNYFAMVQEKDLNKFLGKIFLLNDTPCLVSILSPYNSLAGEFRHYHVLVLTKI